MEFSNIPNDIPDNQLESKEIQICDSGVKVDHNDIEGCSYLPVSRYSRGDKTKGLSLILSPGSIQRHYFTRRNL